MNVFICVYKNFSVAIPMDSISSLFHFQDDNYYNDNYYNSAITKNTENGNTYISLFCLFNIKPEKSDKSSHGIILKNTESDGDIILISNRVEAEIDISEDKIYPIPKTLKDTKFFCFFSGIQFLENSKPVLILNTGQIINQIQTGGYYD